MLPSRIELPQSSVIVRVRSLDSSNRIRKGKGDTKMATYRVILRIEVDEDDILKSRGEDTLAELKENEKDYLRAHVENEMGWLEDSFGHVKTQSVTRLWERKQGSQRPKLTKSRGRN